MKKRISFLMILLSVFFSSSTPAGINNNIDDNQNFIPTITIRGLFTGFIFRNFAVSKEKDIAIHYDLVEVSDPRFPLSQYPNGIVQFREPRGFRTDDFCARVEGEQIITSLCSLGGVNREGSYFSLIPTNTGAVLIKNIMTGKCLFSEYGGIGIGVPSLEECVLPLMQSDEIYRQLWFLAPAFGASGISPT
ncbi:hypothetical protein CYG68_19240 [Morganella morganii]|uniref:Cytolethal distending toxin A/C family n=1 Tax=Morganella morganii TaxID=582 RepID=A0A8I0UAC5_MORMO|nr:hypothetical protein [Morganella morganii]MBE8614503.1 hypothetical protein [Morganella morganii]